ncbi:nuclear transport factor 2 family protein [Pseudomonas sp. PDM26]|uniref:nuclear transport factor 2 family protein n=1 Tax=Pseudomonas TaxID=286 RepID=UPI001C454355|nr:nuclear transport factor 2 family protein [Pseudomonas sp. PDM26]MBV7549845.1 nuclear transport factor 2 family protein [Pseudomonas sp. PDM26]
MKNHNEVENLIRALEDKRYDAILAGDFEAFRAFAHPDLSYAHSNGVVDTLESYLNKCLNGFYVYHRIEHPIQSIKVVGDIALVFGEMNGEITSGGIAKTLRNKALAVWEQRKGEWKLIAYQPTPIPS